MAERDLSMTRAGGDLNWTEVLRPRQSSESVPIRDKHRDGGGGAFADFVRGWAGPGGNAESVMHLLIVDDHRVVREGVAAMAVQAFGAATRVEHAASLAEALAAVATHPGL